jgi:hypothetical protein
MGETTMRLGRVREPMVIGEKRLAGVWLGMRCFRFRERGLVAESEREMSKSRAKCHRK